MKIFVTIRDHRRNLRIRSDELAWALDLTRPQLLAAERGQRRLTAEQWFVLAWILDCRIDDLIVASI